MTTGSPNNHVHLFPLTHPFKDPLRCGRFALMVCPNQLDLFLLTIYPNSSLCIDVVYCPADIRPGDMPVDSCRTTEWKEDGDFDPIA